MDGNSDPEYCRWRPSGYAPGARVCAGYAPGARVFAGYAPGARVCARYARVCAGYAPGARVCAGYARGARVCAGCPGMRRVCAGCPGMRRVCAGCPGMRRVPGYAPAGLHLDPAPDLRFDPLIFGMTPPCLHFNPLEGPTQAMPKPFKAKKGKTCMFETWVLPKPLEANKGKTYVLQTWVPHEKLWRSFSWQRSLGVCRWSRLVREGIQGSC